MQSASEYCRYCPNQVEVMISDAVCVGRQRNHYPYCQACGFGDRGNTAPQKAYGDTHTNEQRLTMIGKVFKAYDVRATYPDPLNEDIAWRIGHAAAIHFAKSPSAPDTDGSKGSPIVVGRDMRKSSPTLCDALIQGIRDAGTEVIDIGMIDTSQIYFAVNHFNAVGGIQTTASHNPARYNGFKICARRGAPVGADTGLNDVRDIAKALSNHKPSASATLKQHSLENEYKAFVLQFLSPPRPLKVAIDASNGMAGKWVPIVFGDVPDLHLININMETTGDFVHDPNPLIDANLDQLREEVRRTGADFGVCFDGDADRCMLIDENAEIVRCDMVTALFARYFLNRQPGSAIVYDLRSSRSVADEIRRHGGRPQRERVGHAFMKKALAENDAVFGGELSGHFYFKDNYYCDSGMLALVHMLNVLTETNESLSRLIKPLKRYYASGERNFEQSDKDGVIKKLAEEFKDGDVDHLDGITVQYDKWWFNVRKSNTEPLLRLNLEADSPAILEEKVSKLSPLLGTPVDH